MIFNHFLLSLLVFGPARKAIHRPGREIGGQCREGAQGIRALAAVWVEVCLDSVTGE